MLKVFTTVVEIEDLDVDSIVGPLFLETFGQEYSFAKITKAQEVAEKSIGSILERIFHEKILDIRFLIFGKEKKILMYYPDIACSYKLAKK